MTKQILPMPQQFYAQVAATPDASAFYFCDHRTGEWHTMNWREYGRQVAKVAGWMQSQGLKKGDRIAILSGNCPEWLMTDLAIQSLGAITVPIYATSSQKDVAYICEHAEITTIFLDHGKRTEILGQHAFERVVIFQKSDDQTTCSGTVSYWDDLVSGEAQPLQTPVDVSEDDIATIIYTSGTTGFPKGVIHTFGTMMATMPPVINVFNEGKPESPADRLFSFLPLSHVAERVLIAMLSVYTGTEVSFARSLETLSDDLGRCRPTILLCVPRLWEKIYEKIQAGLRQASPVKKVVLGLAKFLGGSRLSDDRAFRERDALLPSKISDALVGKKLRAKLGLDRTRMLLTGSAPTRADVMKFFASFGLLIREVYGLTENLCLGVLNDHGTIVIGSCGKLFPGGEIKLLDDGEICFRASWNFKGYYKNEEATRDSIDADGWFHTGDLGEMDAQGYLRIVGRKKELIKTSGGKYVAPVPIEDQLKASPIIGDAMVVGDNQKYCIAIISLDPETTDGRPASDFESDLARHLDAVNAQLASFESIKRIGVIRQPFSVEDGTLTPTMKLKRQRAATSKAAFIDQVYDAHQHIVFEP